MVVPSFANSSAFSFPQIPVWAAIHLSSKVSGVGGSEMIEGIEAFNDCSAFDVECCYLLWPG